MNAKLEKTMDFKCAFIVLSALIVCHQIKVDLKSYSITLCQEFENVNRQQLFEFVVSPDLVDKVNYSFSFVEGVLRDV